MTIDQTSSQNESTSTRDKKKSALALSIAGLLGSLVTTAGLVALAAPAGAAVGPYYTEATAGLHERTAPSSGGAIVGTLAYHTQVYINCQTMGGAYSTGGSPATDSVWDQLANGSYVADYWMSTPAVGTFSPGIPQCGQAPPPPPSGIGQTTGSDPFPWGECTYGADELVHQMMVTDSSQYPAGHNYISIWGNADQWAGYATQRGWQVVGTPTLHSIVVFQPGVQGADRTYGHVAVVTAVYSGSFQIKEMNGTAGFGRYDYRTVSDAAGETFILVPPFS